MQPDHADKRDVDIIHETARRGSDVVGTLLALSHDHAEAPMLVEIDSLLDQNQSYFQTLIGPTATIVLDLGAAGAKVRVGRSKVLLAISHILMDMGLSTAAGGTVCLQTRADPDGSGQSASFNLIVTNGGTVRPADDVELSCLPILPSGTPQERRWPRALRQFIAECGGTIDICFSERSGLIVNVAFDLPPAAALYNPSEGGKPGDRQLRVLLVEDEIYALEAFQEAIEDEGHLVTPACDAMTALEALRHNSFDVLLTDVVMPGISGMELARRACDYDRGLPVIIMSGYIPDRAEWQPEWDFIRKPMDWDDLFEKLKILKPRQRHTHSG